MAHPLLLSTVDFDEYLRETRERSERTPTKTMNKEIVGSDEVRITCQHISLFNSIYYRISEEAKSRPSYFASLSLIGHEKETLSRHHPKEQIIIINLFLWLEARFACWSSKKVSNSVFVLFSHQFF